MKDSKTAGGKGSLNLSMNKRTHRLWRKTSLVLSLRQLEKLRIQAPTSMPCTELPMCPPSTQSSRSAPQLSVLQSAPPRECRVLTLPSPDREDTRPHSFPLFGILVCRGLTYPYSSSNPLSKPSRSTPTGAIKSAQSAQMPPV